MKKILSGLFMLITTLALMGCSFFADEPQEFSGTGITITLNDSFQETDTMYVPFYLESFDYIFTGERESKDLFVGSDINTLEEYTNAVIEFSGSNGEEVLESEDGSYFYSYYYETVDEEDFGYMLICMESDGYYYIMNFACYEDKLDNSKEQFFAWADTIEVE